MYFGVAIAVVWALAFLIGYVCGRLHRSDIVPVRERVSIVMPMKFVELPGLREEIEKEIAAKLPN
jgi:hypothetical protein